MSKFDKTAVYGRENPFIPSPETMDALKDALIEEADERSDMLIGMTTAPDGRKVLRRQSAGRNTGWRSLVGLRYRIQTKEEADELRLDYRRFFEGYVERTDKSERRNLLGLEHRTVDGAYRYTVEGVVADCEETSVSNGYVSRLCLMFPHVVNSDGSQTLIDSHIWLATFVKNTVIRPDRIEPHNGSADRLMTIRLGDTLRVDAGLCAYTDKRGRHRFGLADWTPLDSHLRYLQLRSDGTTTPRVVSERLCGREYDICWLERDGRPGFRSVMLDGLNARVKAGWSSYDWRHRPFLSDGDGFPSICLDQYLTLDPYKGEAHVVSR